MPTYASERILVVFFAVPMCVLWTYTRRLLALPLSGRRVGTTRACHIVSRTLVANFKLVSVSLRCASSGLAITNISVFELPPREYCSRYVNYNNSDG